MGQPCLVVCVAFVPGLSDHVILCVVHMLDVEFIEKCACIMMYMYVLVCKHLFYASTLTNNAHSFSRAALFRKQGPSPCLV